MTTEMSLPDMPPVSGSGLPYVTAAQASTVLKSGLAIACELAGSALPAVFKAMTVTLDAQWEIDAEAFFIRRLLNGRDADLRSGTLIKLREEQDLALANVFKTADQMSPASLTADRLELVEDSESLSTESVIDPVARRMEGATDDRFRDLHLIVQHLTGRPTLRNGDDPFAPRVFLRALLQAAIDLSLTDKGWALFVGMCEKPLADEIGMIQLAVLDHFKRHGFDAVGIRRDIAARQAAERAALAKQQAEQRAAAAAPSPTGDAGSPGMPAATGFGDGGSAFAGAGGGVADGYASSAGWADTGGGRGSAAPIAGYTPRGALARGFAGPRIDTPQAPSGYVLNQLMARMQANVSGAIAPAGFAPSSPAEESLLRAVGDLQQLGLEGLAGATLASAQQGDATAWREHLINTASRTVDKLTIEIVGLMFDHMLQDPALPSEIKSMLSRLQFPVLKAALIDADFFASNGHPARKLIDRIAIAAAGWEPYGDENDRFLAEVDRIVKAVLQRFEKDFAVFEELRVEFEAFLADIGPRDADPVARAKRALEEAEKREVLIVNTTIQVRRAFDKVDLEQPIRDFLVGPWVQTLVEAALRDNETPGFSKRFREAIHDLVWSVQPKANNDDRRRLTTLIPNLIRVLRDGMALARMSEHDQQTFLRHLMQAHAVAVKPVDQATYIKSSLVSSEVKSKLEDLNISGTQPIITLAGGFRVSTGAVMRAAEEYQADVRMPVAVTETGTFDRIEETRLDEEVASWQRGTWFEMYDGTDTVKVRLRWISPLRTLFLFSANHEKDAHVLPAAVIKSYLKRGYLKPVGATSLTRRAVDQVVNEFEKQPQFAKQLVDRYGEQAHGSTPTASSADTLRSSVL